MKFFDAIPQVLKLWGWYISKNGAKRAPDIEKNGAGQVFLHYLGRNIKKSVLNMFMNTILTVLITYD